MNEQSMTQEDLIPQNHDRGPGWFLKISYVVISLICLYYLYANWSWKSNYDDQQDMIHRELAK